MSDEIDIANDRVEEESARGVALVRMLAANMPAGDPGECERCGEESKRLVNGACARCRDKFKL